MVLYAAYFVWRHILPYEGRRAAWILTEDPENSEVNPFPTQSLLQLSSARTTSPLPNDLLAPNHLIKDISQMPSKIPNTTLSILFSNL